MSITKKQIAQVIAYLTSGSPRGSYTETTLDKFYDGFGDLEYEGVVKAARAITRRTRFLPDVSDVRDEYYRQMGVGDGDTEWEEILRVVKKGPPYEKSLKNPVAQRALEIVGGMPAVRMTQYPDLLRKSFLESYRTVREREISEPVVTAEMLGIAHGAQGKLAGPKSAIGPGEAHAPDRHDGAKQARQGQYRRD